MKQSILVILCSLLFALDLFGQSINNTLGMGGSFIVKDGSTTFLNLSQSDGYLNLNKSLNLANTTSSTLGVIFKGANRFIHDYQAAGTDGFNTFVGLNAGNFVMSGTGGQGSYNTAVGAFSLTQLSTGFTNSAFGYQSLYSNTMGGSNSAFGTNSLYANTTGQNNSAFGYQSLVSNSIGYDNSAFGTNSLYSNTAGQYNSAFGSFSLYNNSDGTNNSTFGFNSLYNLTQGDNNSAFGTNSLAAITTGEGNSALGYSAGSYITSGSNNTCIGSGAQVPDAVSNHQVRIGNEDVTYAGVQVAWTITSDKRWKSNIAKSDLGIDFVSRLNPVSYTRKNDEKQRTEYGFIAQEIEEVLKEGGIENAGMLTIDDQSRYELRYNDLLAPMVKAIQELKTENDALKRELEEMKERQEEWAAGRNNEGTKQRQDETTKVSFNEN